MTAAPGSPTFCPACGAGNRLGQRFCAHCGAALSRRPDAPTSEAPLRRPREPVPDSALLKRLAQVWEQINTLPSAAKLAIGGACAFVLAIVIAIAAVREQQGSSQAEPASVSPAFPVTAAPSFDCERASTWSARVICGDTTLAALDVRMAALYAARRAQLPTRAARLALRDEQRIWLAERDTCEHAPMTIECIQNLYDNRITELEQPIVPEVHNTVQSPAIALPTCSETNHCELFLGHVMADGERESDKLYVPSGFCLNIGDEAGRSPVRDGRVQLYTWNAGSYQGLWTPSQVGSVTDFQVSSRDASIRLFYWFVPMPSSGC